MTYDARIQIRAPAELVAAIREIAVQQDRPTGYVTRRALVEYVERQRTAETTHRP